MLNALLAFFALIGLVGLAKEPPKATIMTEGPPGTKTLIIMLAVISISAWLLAMSICAGAAVVLMRGWP